jgi:iron-sulfur cluster assembly accessory protein
MTVIAEDALAKTPVKVSGRAARKIAHLIEETAGSAAFRVAVEGGGCSGFQYRFDLVDSIDGDDLVVRRDGAIVVVDSTSLPYMLGAEIDLTDDLMGESLQVNNPLATASCGCGTSFAI